MEKSFTLFDAFTYQLELEAIQRSGSVTDVTPGKQVVKNILNYARALKVVNTRATGSTLLLMN
jgi:hypothetical protein